VKPGAGAGRGRGAATLLASAWLVGLFGLRVLLAGVASLQRGEWGPGALRLAAAVVLVLLARGLWARRRRAWAWSVGLCALKLCAWALWVGGILPAYDVHLEWSAVLAPGQVLEQAPAAVALVLLLLPATRRAIEPPPT
jgi:hypothetical protein